ncbi:ribosome biogenesis GTP-binding protein YihA/YsxC [Paracoccaceae bacterium]|nr:ribosome biogenesis GTP-binding protein YihA/YsxC [Paracoccaceae bacterium]
MYFLKGVAGIDDLPSDRESEVCFIGRSNVGKSSLINALFDRRNLARTSKTPGRTQELNFFSLGEKSYVVDLPGYGYAKASKDKRSDWQGLIKSYIAERRSLKRVFTLVDARHGLKENDREFFFFLDTYAVNYQIILTKIDKVKKPDMQKLLDEMNEKIKEHPACHTEVFLASALKKSGISEIRAAMLLILGLDQNN